jgi:hypothetical protein
VGIASNRPRREQRSPVARFHRIGYCDALD